MTREHEFLGGNRRNCLSKNLVETVHLQLEKKEESIREVGGQRLQGIAEGTSSAPVWPAYRQRRFPGETSVRGSIAAREQRRRDKRVPVRSARKTEIKGKTEKRKEWRGQRERRRREDEDPAHKMTGLNDLG